MKKIHVSVTYLIQKIIKVQDDDEYEKVTNDLECKLEGLGFDVSLENEEELGEY